jgi:uncharacterized protein (UPF0261 family)
MRTTPEENRRMGEWIGAKLNACQGPVRFLIPEKGVDLAIRAGLATTHRLRWRDPFIWERWDRQ